MLALRLCERSREEVRACSTEVLCVVHAFRDERTQFRDFGHQ
jgi:hypothetical protein